MYSRSYTTDEKIKLKPVTVKASNSYEILELDQKKIYNKYKITGESDH